MSASAVAGLGAGARSLRPDTAGAEVVLKVDDLTKVYVSKGNSCEALRGMSLEVRRGEFTGIMGPSGSGKTTFLNIAATIDRPTSGTVSVDGDDIGRMSESQLAAFRREKLGFLFQDSNLLDPLSLRENIALPLALASVAAREIDPRVEAVAKTLGIAEILDKHPYEVSGGQRQRAAAARALVHNPRLILADEPTGALDSKSSADLLHTLVNLNENAGATIVMVTHDAFAASYCKRVLFMKDGRLYAEAVRADGRKEFFRQILDILSAMGGAVADVI